MSGVGVMGVETQVDFYNGKYYNQLNASARNENLTKNETNEERKIKTIHTLPQTKFQLFQTTIHKKSVSTPKFTAH